jgi:hypothetical protein
MLWFGEDWGAPVCKEAQRVTLNTLVECLCARCGEPVRPGTSGIMLDVGVYHLGCFVDWIVPPPIPLGQAPIELTGMIMPLRDGRPQFLVAPHLGRCLVLFSTQQRLGDALADGITECDGIGFVEDGTKFLGEVPSDVPIIVDPHRVQDGSWRYVRVHR